MIPVAELSGVRQNNNPRDCWFVEGGTLDLFIGIGRLEMLGGTGESGHANYTLIYEKSDHEIEMVEKAVEYLNRTITQNASPSPTPTHSAADEIMKLKDLLDAGILTQEEFDHKKRVLLGM